MCAYEDLERWKMELPAGSERLSREPAHDTIAFVILTARHHDD